MKFTRITPHQFLEPFIECYWSMESDDLTPGVEKIIPDGFTEIIFNFGDVYEAKMQADWFLLAPNLLAGQISSYFYLQNTGLTHSVGIKLKPAALTQLIDLQMNDLVDKIVELETIPNHDFSDLKEKIRPVKDEQHLKQMLDDYFITISKNSDKNPIEDALEMVFKNKGMVSVADMADATHVSERQLERLFKKYIGLAPKYYTRIIRFNHIFQLMQTKDKNLAEVIYLAGFYDQSHFIRDFKAFTGEDPSAYLFKAQNMANFFLNK